MPGTELLRRVMEYGADLGLTFIDHCEDSTLARGWVMNEGPLSGSLGVKGQPPVGEAVQAARDIMLAEYLNLPVHIAHVSSALTVDIIAWGKARGVKVTAETCPHYLTLDESALDGYNTNAKVSPPLRRPEDREALRRAIKDGTIDILATDHAPHSAEEKARPLAKAPSGMIGLETSLAIALTELYHTGRMKLPDLIRRMTYNPAAILRLGTKGRLSLGSDADIAIFDPEEEWTIDPEQFASKARNTPFAGRKVKGRVKYTIVAGNIIYQDNM